MDGAFNTSRDKRRPTINITSLIDVMFLLLIFFMVSSTFKEELGIDISLPEAESAASQEMAPHDITVDGDGNFFFAQRSVDDQGLRESLTALLAEESDALLVLRADRAANFGRVARAIDIARAVGGERLVIPTEFLGSVPATREAHPGEQ
ncbi:MAG: biopolymer transporter ExbD [Candidatus Hydrogenedentes bacterium]|jgi:biopolymer transport protein ExbD|nr:biopolymer transporter ExbD [Candidatus Hydrogenedentota bacterium]